MPIVSQAQQRWAYAKQNEPGKEGDAAREFIAATPKSAYKRLPAKVKDGKPVRRRSFGSLKMED